MSELLQNAEKAARVNDYTAAERDCLEHIAQFPDDVKAFRLLAHVYSLDRRHADAIDVLTKAIALSADKPEPADHFNRGRWRLTAHETAGAIADFSNVVELCKRYEDNYYLEAAYLHRAIARSGAGSSADALEDLQHVGDDCEVFVLGQLYSKSVLRDALR